MLRKQFLGVEN